MIWKVISTTKCYENISVLIVLLENPFLNLFPKVIKLTKFMKKYLFTAGFPKCHLKFE
jgi:hypothetical protein